MPERDDAVRWLTIGGKKIPVHCPRWLFTACMREMLAGNEAIVRRLLVAYWHA